MQESQTFGADTAVPAFPLAAWARNDIEIDSEGAVVHSLGPFTDPDFPRLAATASRVDRVVFSPDASRASFQAGDVGVDLEVSFHHLVMTPPEARAMHRLLGTLLEAVSE